MYKCAHIHAHMIYIKINVKRKTTSSGISYYLSFVALRLFSLVNVNTIRARTYSPPPTIKITGMRHENALSVRVIKKKSAYGKKINKLHISTCEIKIGRRNRKLMKRLRKTTLPTMNSVQAV